MPGDPPEGRRGRVFRRRVFYIPGYDPIHPRRYRELYRKEGAAQAALSGYAMELKPKKLRGPYGWHVRAELEGRSVETDVEVLVWSDIVKDSMDQGIPGTYLQLLRTAWAYIGSGALFRLMRLRKGPIIAALYPIFALLLQLALALGLGAGIVGLAMAVVPGQIGAALAAGLGTAAVVAMLRWFKRKDGKFFAYYLMHDYAYSAQSRGANPAALEARMAAFRMTIAEALLLPYDEVLVVGHSSGAHLAVSILADLIRAGLPAQAPVLSFLSLGQVVPMVSFLPEAKRLRGDLQYLAASDALTWVDVTAPGDGCAFALCDPVAVSGVAPEGQRWPLVFSAAFTQTLRPETWAALRWRFFRLHFQYLCAFDNLPGTPTDYDYFRVTAGPLTLTQRFGARPSSKSRIDRAVNRYTTVA
ncbi:hypothetical protein KM031_03565 [Gemmobacter fulvus]|uniref:Uncharacterized protein n=2 Tax=Gemmobacter fulvus TaxID=2840474 RepID=A0A975P9Y6_9RHOB|nr:hypothetical protein [Gemmobacter fulvus]MBT9244092.1 hypothetical protein [Gemmobacter fulvus]QWK91893.1 hypothetical protein KM031_03565 [Gemmobacter fulvus]